MVIISPGMTKKISKLTVAFLEEVAFLLSIILEKKVQLFVAVGFKKDLPARITNSKTTRLDSPNSSVTIDKNLL